MSRRVAVGRLALLLLRREALVSGRACGGALLGWILAYAVVLRHSSGEFQH